MPMNHDKENADMQPDLVPPEFAVAPWPSDAKYRPVLRKMLKVCEEAGLSFQELKRVSELFKEMAEREIRSFQENTTFRIRKVWMAGGTEQLIKQQYQEEE